MKATLPINLHKWRDSTGSGGITGVPVPCGGQRAFLTDWEEGPGYYIIMLIMMNANKINVLQKW